MLGRKGHSHCKTMSGYSMGSANLLGASPTISGLAVLTLLDKPMRAGVASLAAPLQQIGRRFDRGPVVVTIVRVAWHRN